MKVESAQVIDALKHVRYPGTGTDIVALGMVGDDIAISGNVVSFTLHSAKANDPFMPSVMKAAEAAIKTYVKVESEELKVIFSRFPGDQVPVRAHGRVGRVESEELRVKSEELKVIFSRFPGDQVPDRAHGRVGRVESEELRVKSRKMKVKVESMQVIAIHSGKGGVGKSTIAANLAITLAQQGYRVGLLDADIYGPSMPKMFRCEDARPELVEVDGRDLIVPIERYGVKLLSIGFFTNAGQATVWRGGMASSAVRQMVEEAFWGVLDYLLIDLPPGTSDIHLTLLTVLRLTGVIVVTTPQPVALIDAEKGVDMFRNEKINVPVIGLIENMSYFTPAELPESRYYIFGRDGGKCLAERLQIPFLGAIPLVQSIREGSDEGIPIALNYGHPARKMFEEIVGRLMGGE